MPKITIKYMLTVVHNQIILMIASFPGTVPTQDIGTRVFFYINSKYFKA